MKIIPKKCVATKRNKYFIFGIYEHRTITGVINNDFKCVTPNFFSFEMKGYFFAHISCYQIIFSTTLSA
jgi:hypothetical protein